ncbi:gliding motility-associated C-terminal domain-containing protein [Larkinella insperata]|uniref:Gliding motility-associated C-terminal domain-containing protein n=1 Tax=Larkinella insperata TaxID=332158 RepID=A0ABW3Q7V6_9BACT
MIGKLCLQEEAVSNRIIDRQMKETFTLGKDILRQLIRNCRVNRWNDLQARRLKHQVSALPSDQVDSPSLTSSLTLLLFNRKPLSYFSRSNICNLLHHIICWYNQFNLSLNINRWIANTMALILFSVGMAFAQQPNLYIHTKIDKARPALNSLVSYTIVVGNDGNGNAGGVVVKNALSAGAQYSSHTIPRGANAFAPTTGHWQIGSIASGDSAVLELKARVVERGVVFNTAEVIASQGTDPNSVPNNQNVSEDDLAVTCFSVPLYWYPGDEYSVTSPIPITNVQWTRNGLTQFTPDQAVATGNTLVIKSPGNYSFSGTLGSCPVGGCCAIEVIPGPECQLNLTAVASPTCEASPLVLNATPQGGSAPYQYVWTGPNGFSRTGQSQTIPVATAANAGVYTVTVTDANNCTAIASTTALVGTLPTAGCTSPVCEGETIRLSATSGGTSYQWYGPNGFTSSLQNPTIPNATAANAGSYTVVVTGTTICSGTAVTTLTVLPKPVIAASVSNSACVGGSFVLSAVVSGGAQPYQYIWTGPNGFYQTGQTVTINNAQSTQAGSYTLTVFGSNGCSATTVTAPITVTACSCNLMAAVLSPSVCTGGTVNLTATSGFTSYTWRGPNNFSSTVQNPVITNAQVTQSGTYTLTVSGPNCTGTATVDVTVSPAPIAQASSQTVCSGGSASIQLNASGGTSYRWEGPDGFSNNQQNPVITNATATNTGRYTVIVTTSSGCTGVATTAVTVGLCQVPAVCKLEGSLTANSPAVCLGGSAVLTASAQGAIGSLSYVWSGVGLSASSGSQVTASNLTATSTFTVVITDRGLANCSIIRTGTVTVNPAPVAQASSQTLCAGGVGSLELSASGGTSYQWRGPNGYSSTQPNPVIAPATSANSGHYMVVVSTASGCTALASTVVTVGDCSQPPVCHLSGQVVSSVPSVCAGGSAVLTASAQGATRSLSYVWSGVGLSASSGSQVTASNLTATSTFTVVITDRGLANCSIIRTGTVTVDPQPVITLTAGPTCAPDLQSYSLTVGINPVEATLTASVGTVVGNTITDLPIGSGVVLTATTASGCSSTLSIAPPSSCPCPVVSAPIVINNGTICQGQPTPTLSVSVGVGLQAVWYTESTDGTPVANNQLSYTPNQTTSGTYTYYVEAVDVVSGCKSATRTPITLTIHPLPIAQASSQTVCSGGSASIQLNASGGTSYSWEGPDGFSNNQQNPVITNATATNTGRYTVIVTTSSGCTGVATTAVTVGLCQVPAVCKLEGSLTTNSPAVCLGGSAVLTASAQGATGSLSYVWSGVGLSASSGSQVTASNLTATSTFTVVITDRGLANCSISRTVTVTVNPQPNVTVIATANPTSCADSETGSITLGSLLPNESYRISYSRNNQAVTTQTRNANGNGTIELNALVAGAYSITVSTGSCSSNPVTATLTAPEIPERPSISVSPAVTTCLGETVTLTATGEAGAGFQWTGSGLSATTGAVVSVTPTEVGTQAYFVRQTINNCTSEESTSATVTGVRCTTCTTEPPVISCTVTDVCPGDAVELSASNCTGTVVWSTGQTGQTIIVTPSVSTTYTAQCQLPGCLSAPSKPIAIKVSDPQPPVISADALTICVGGTVSLTATCCAGTVIWSTGATGSIITVSPGEPTTYYANCRIHNCISAPSNPITVRPGSLPTPHISSNSNTVCPGETAMLTVSNCVGISKWSTGETTASILVSPSQTTSYTVLCQQGSCVSPVSDSHTITVVVPHPPMVDISADVVCLGSSVQLTAMGCTGTVIWSTGATGSSIRVSPSGNTTYRAFCKVGNCTSGPSQPLSVTVVNPAAPIVKSDKTMICAGEVVTLTAEGCAGGQVIWSDNTTGNSITVRPGATTTYTAQCREFSCTSVTSNAITVNVTNSNAPTPTVTASTTAICAGEPVTLTASGCGAGTVVWSTGATGNSLVVNPTQTTEYYAACKMSAECNSTPAKVTVTVHTPSKPVIRVCKCTDGHICPGDEIQLTVTGCTGTPLWSTGATSTSILVSPTQTTAYTVVCQNSFCTSSPSEAYTVVVDTPTSPVVWASKPEIEPGETVTLSASGCVGGQIIWSTGATGSSIDVNPTTTTSYYAHCKISGCLSDPTPVIVKIKGECDVPAPTVTASATVVCYGGSATLTATGCANGTIVWSNGETGSHISIGNMTANRPYTAICKISDACVSLASAPTSVSVITLNPPTIAADNKVLCPGEAMRLTAIGCVGTVTWSTGATGSSIDIQPAATTDYWATCSLGDCVSERSPLSTVQVGTPVSPTITASATTVCFGEAVTLMAAGCPNGNVIWSNNQVGAQIIITPALSATYSAVCCTSNACKSGKSNELVVTVQPKVRKPLVANVTNTCPLTTADLTKAVSGSVSIPGGVFEFYTSSTLDPAQKVANPNAVPAGTYYVVEKPSTACYSLPSQVLVTILNCNDVALCTTNPATASAGPDATICSAKEYKLNGTIGGAATSAIWTSSGTGTFDNAALLNATYKPSLADIQAGSVTLTFSTNDPDGNGPCQAAQDVMKLTIEGLKVQPTIGSVNTVLCHGDSVVLQALPDGYSYLWNTMATTQSIVVKTSGTYSVQLVDNNGCTSVASEAVTIQVGEPIESPIVPMMARNVCPEHTVNLTKLIESNPVTAGGRFEFHIDSKPDSPVVMRPDSVGRGIFYAFERTPSGCYSEPSMIDVAIFDCNTDTCRTDLYVTYTVDKPSARPGETVTFEVKLGNNGKCAATHSDIRIILPPGLELVSPGNLVVDAHGHLGAWITVLPEYNEVSYHYTARVLTQGPIVNLVEITYLDQVDPELANNKATVTIGDSTVTQPVAVGVAKALKGVLQKEETLFEFTYDIAVTNYSDQDATQVQVTDDVQSVFDPHVIESVSVALDKESTLMLNANYSGWVGRTQLLTTESTVKAGATQHILLKVNVRTHPDGSLTKTFLNQAYLLAQVSSDTINDVSTNGSKADPDNDGDPKNNSEPTPARFDSHPPSQIGVALAVTNVDVQADSSYNVTYKVTVRNYGTTDLTQVQLADSLIGGFEKPVSYSVVSLPVVGEGSTLAPNPNFDGSGLASLLDATNSSLAVGASDTVLVTVNIKPNSVVGPFYTQVVGTALHADTLVTDLSNNGFNPAPFGNVPTAVRFDLPPSLLGVAKSVSKLEDLGAGVYNVTYTIKVANMGSQDLKQVQVVDNLTETFGNDVLIGPGKPKLVADAGLTVDTTYTGQGTLTNLLIDSLSTLPRGTSRNIHLTVRVDVRNSSREVYHNTALAKAVMLDGNTMLSDTSTKGSNVDPDNDLDPRNNSIPTDVRLRGVPVDSHIGVAMAVKDTARQVDGSYKVIYQIIVRNYGSKDFTDVQVSDKLTEVFNSMTGASYKLPDKPSVSSGSQLVVNSNYDGDADSNLLIPGSKLAAGRTDTLLLPLIIMTDGRTTPYLNTAYAWAVTGSDTLRDTSTDGFEPDLNGNSNPTEIDESVATPLTLNGKGDEIIIPEGFSPNGDNINDRFVIRNTGGATVSLEVFNRWGHTVYRNHDYKNDWDGTTNTGARVGSNSKGLPEGTYFYIVELSDGRKFIRFMTINR